MNDSLDSSMLVSESIFIPLDKSYETESLVSDQAECEPWHIHKSDTIVTDNRVISPNVEEEISQRLETSLGEPATQTIHITQEEAMRLLHMAASLLQANIKRYLQQKHYAKIITQKRAATKIQAIWRGYRTRHLDVRIMHLKHEYLCEKFKCHVFAEERTKQIFTEIILSLSSNVEKLNLAMTQKEQRKQLKQQRKKDLQNLENGKLEDDAKVVDLISDDDEDDVDVDLHTNDEISDIKTDTILKDSLEIEHDSKVDAAFDANELADYTEKQPVTELPGYANELKQSLIDTDDVEPADYTEKQPVTAAELSDDDGGGDASDCQVKVQVEKLECLDNKPNLLCSVDEEKLQLSPADTEKIVIEIESSEDDD